MEYNDIFNANTLIATVSISLVLGISTVYVLRTPGSHPQITIPQWTYPGKRYKFTHTPEPTHKLVFSEGGKRRTKKR